MSTMKKIFITYSWDNQIHKDWTRMLADRLEEIKEITISFDQYDLDSFSDKNYFMEKGVYENDIVLVVITGAYNIKANARVGGVGLETIFSATRLGDETLTTGKSNIIPILREGEVVPNYLKHKLYIDFRDDNDFEKSFAELLAHINGQSKVVRPGKKYSLSNIPPHQDLTRIEDFLKINHKKRRLIFDRAESTDYSNGNRIKFELWETSSPSIHHYLFLFNNIIIRNTIVRLCELLKRDKVTIKNLTVLKTGGSQKGHLEKLFLDNGLNIDLTELTYPEFIWDYCIDEHAKNFNGIYTSPYFIDQSLVSNDIEQRDLGPAFDYIKNQLQDTNQSTANVIIAPGGTGKTTLCSFLANYFQEQKNLIAVFLQSEEIKKSARFIKGGKISSVYDLYERYASVCMNQDDEYVFDKVTFEVALLTGKLVLIIDGLDELVSLFPDGFDMDGFLKSIDDLNREMASSKVILTSRNDDFSDEIMSKYSNLNKFKLIGFDSETCRRYLAKRYKKFSDSQLMMKRALANIEPLIARDENQRILPFIVDLMSSLIESSNSNEIFDFKLSFDGKTYESNTDLTDYLVYSILRRESIRQDIEISIKDVLDIFMELSFRYNDSFPKSELEEIIKVFYTEKADELTGKLLRNPLISVNGVNCKFKYDFISDYFNALNVINCINESSTSESFITLVAKHASGESNVFKDVVKYFQNIPLNDELIPKVKNIVDSIKKKLSSEDVFKPNDCKFKAISFFVNLLLNINGALSKKDRIDLINKVFSDGKNIFFLAIYGKSKPIDLSNAHVFNSRFIGFESFTSSKLENSKFSNCYFDGVNGDNGVLSSSVISADMFDSCRLGDLEVLIEKRQAELNGNKEIVEKELRKFFTSFFYRGRFKDQKRSYIKFSDRVKNIDNTFLDLLIQKKVISVNAEKSDETYYIVSSSYRDSIYSFIMNNTVDEQLRGVLSILI